VVTKDLKIGDCDQNCKQSSGDQEEQEISAKERDPVRRQLHSIHFQNLPGFFGALLHWHQHVDTARGCVTGVQDVREHQSHSEVNDKSYEACSLTTRVHSVKAVNNQERHDNVDEGT
jgi:hypothetical protein